MCMEGEQWAGEGDREAERWILQIIRVLALIRTLVTFYILQKVPRYINEYLNAGYTGHSIISQRSR